MPKQTTDGLKENGNPKDPKNMMFKERRERLRDHLGGKISQEMLEEKAEIGRGVASRIECGKSVNLENMYRYQKTLIAAERWLSPKLSQKGIFAEMPVDFFGMRPDLEAARITIGLSWGDVAKATGLTAKVIKTIERATKLVEKPIVNNVEIYLRSRYPVEKDFPILNLNSFTLNHLQMNLSLDEQSAVKELGELENVELDFEEKKASEPAPVVQTSGEGLVLIEPVFRGIMCEDGSLGDRCPHLLDVAVPLPPAYRCSLFPKSRIRITQIKKNPIRCFSCDKKFKSPSTPVGVSAEIKTFEASKEM